MIIGNDDELAGLPAGCTGTHLEQNRAIEDEYVRLRKLLTRMNREVTDSKTLASGTINISDRFGGLKMQMSQLEPSFKKPRICSWCYLMWDAEVHEMVIFAHTNVCPRCKDLEYVTPDHLELPTYTRIQDFSEEDVERAKVIMQELLPQQEEPQDEPEEEIEYQSDEQGNLLDPDTGKPFPILRRDRDGDAWWIEFPGVQEDPNLRPSKEVTVPLRKCGWSFKGYRKQWWKKGLFMSLPEGFKYLYGGFCDYSGERVDRLLNARDKAIDRVGDYADFSDHYAAKISGGVLVRGHRMEHRQRKILERAEGWQKKSEFEAKKVKWLEQKARGSIRHREKKHDRSVIYRRLERLKAEKRKIERNLEELLLDLIPKPGETFYRSPEQIEQDRKDYLSKLALLEPEIQFNEEEYAELGAIAADQEEVKIEAGDMIEIKSFTGSWYKVARNDAPGRKTISVWDTWDSRPVPDDQKRWFIRKIDRTDFIRIICKHDGSPVPELPVSTAKKDIAPAVHIYHKEAPLRTLQVQTIEEVNGWAYKKFHLFPITQLAATTLFADEDLDALAEPEEEGQEVLTLEPQAGTGALIMYYEQYCQQNNIPSRIHFAEIQEELHNRLEQKGYTSLGQDFLQVPQRSLYDQVITNPPFKAWWDHIKYALAFLRRNGRLHGVVPMTYKGNVEFMSLLKRYGSWKELESGYFADSGTNVPVCLITICKGWDGDLPA